MSIVLKARVVDSLTAGLAASRDAWVGSRLKVIRNDAGLATRFLVRLTQRSVNFLASRGMEIAPSPVIPVNDLSSAWVEAIKRGVNCANIVVNDINTARTSRGEKDLLDAFDLEDQLAFAQRHLTEAIRNAAIEVLPGGLDDFMIIPDLPDGVILSTPDHEATWGSVARRANRAIGVYPLGGRDSFLKKFTHLDNDETEYDPMVLHCGANRPTGMYIVSKVYDKLREGDRTKQLKGLKDIRASNLGVKFTYTDLYSGVVRANGTTDNKIYEGTYTRELELVPEGLDGDGLVVEAFVYDGGGSRVNGSFVFSEGAGAVSVRVESLPLSLNA